jgi:hypothetical protein
MDTIYNPEGITYEDVLSAIYRAQVMNENLGTPRVSYDGFTEGGVPLLTVDVDA